MRAGYWIGINDTHLNTLQAFQDTFISRLLHVPIVPRAGTEKSLIRMDSGMLMMKWRIAERKLQFTNKLRTKDDNNIVKRFLNDEVILGLKVLKS